MPLRTSKDSKQACNRSNPDVDCQKSPCMLEKKTSVPDVFENVASFTRLSSVLEELSIKDKNYMRKKISIDDISFMLRE